MKYVGEDDWGLESSKGILLTLPQASEDSGMYLLLLLSRFSHVQLCATP